MATALAIDLSCLFLAPTSRTPRGIDRVELAYARRFLNRWPGECFAVLPTPWGVRTFERARALAGIAVVGEWWRETIPPAQDSAYIAAKSALLGQGAGRAPGERSRLGISDILRGFHKIVSATGFSFGQPAVRHLPRNAIYLNVGQLGVFRPVVSWLGRRKDVSAVFMVHDVTPIEHPDHHAPALVKSHHAIVRNAAEFATALIAPSEAARASIRLEMRKYGRSDLPAHVELLPVPSEFLGATEKDPELAWADYFIVCGAIDPHKNHRLLLEVWQGLAAQLGARTPKLVIAGSPYATSGPVLELIERAAAEGGHIVLASGLSTPALRSLMASARALLMPSVSEGFGLPIVEALAQGTPVIASDIPSHWEAGKGGDVTYVDPANVSAWLSAILELRTEGADARVGRTPYKAKTWDDYFAGIEAFLRELVYPR